MIKESLTMIDFRLLYKFNLTHANNLVSGFMFRPTRFDLSDSTHSISTSFGNIEASLRAIAAPLILPWVRF